MWASSSCPRPARPCSDGPPDPRPTPAGGWLSSPHSTPWQFQGEWFVLGLAGNTYTVADRSLLSPFTATFTLNKNNRFEVAYAMFRGWDPVPTPPPEPSAVAVSRVRLPGRVRAPGPASQLKSRAHPELSQARHGPETPSLERAPRVPFRGQRCITWSYELISQSQPGVFSVDHSGEPGADPEEIHVYDTDYASFALLLSRKQSGLQWVLRAEYGPFRLSCWTSSSAWSELRASRTTTSSSRT
ncbi:epididymal-specific lipocalin-12 isoform X3 [Capricornis sumatraensis]|uniref:epididymal-specific lipocalin-12 isoform X3 n=1 Tax=Capricornis sumatraensis TaxID=34865 RepID=UPI003604CFDB